jgi:hypothetical protein
MLYSIESESLLLQLLQPQLLLLLFMVVLLLLLLLVLPLSSLSFSCVGIRYTGNHDSCQ